MPPSPGYLRENPNYRQAGDWRYDSRRNQANAPRRERSPEPGSNLDVLHFQNQGYSRDEAQQMASDARDSGMRTGFGGKGLEPNRNLTPRERSRMGLDKGRSSAPAGPTADQRKWARSFRESQTRAPLGSADAAPSVDDTPGAASASARSGFLSKYGLKPQEADSRPPLRAAAGPLSLSPTATAVPKGPLNFSRSALVEGAKQSGDFAGIRKGFNTQSAAAQTGMRMNERGGVSPLNKTTTGADGLTPYARERFGPAVEDIRARRDFARGEAPVKLTRAPEGAFAGQESLRSQTLRPVVSAEKTNPYGTATATFGPRAPGAGGTMTDPLTGQTVPMKSYLAQQTAVQDTKFGANAGKTGEDYFNPKAIRESFQQRKGRV